MIDTVVAAALAGSLAGSLAAGSIDPPGIVTFPLIEDYDNIPPRSLASDGRFVAVALPDNTTQGPAGDVLIFDLETGQQVVRIEPPVPDLMNRFAQSIAVGHGMLFVATPLDQRLEPVAGTVSVYSFPGGELLSTLSAPEPDPSDFFGTDLAVGGDRLVVPAPSSGFPGENSGKMYVYSLPELVLERTIADQNTELQVAPFPVAVTEDYIVGIRSTQNVEPIEDAVLLVYDIATGEKLAEAQPVVDGQTITSASFDLAADGRYAVVADLGSDSAGPNAGEVFVFDFEQMAFVGSILPPAGRGDLFYGISLDVRDGFAAISSPVAPTPSPFNEGRVDVVSLPGGRVVREIEAFGGGGSDGFDGQFRDFGQGTLFVRRGVIATSYSFSTGARVDWIPVPELCPADVNRDCELDSADFFAWVDAFGSNTPECDVNADSVCDGSDFFAWVSAFGEGC